METKVDARLIQAPAARAGWRRLVAPAAILLAFLVTDRGGRAAANSGIDPLDVLDLTVRNNILFILDTSGSMMDPPDQNGDLTDDPAAKMYQAKDAIRQVVADQSGKVNFGLASFNILNPNKRLVNSNNGSPLVYVSADANAADWAGYFSQGTTNFSDYDANTSNDTFRSLRSNPSFGGPNGSYPTGCSTTASQLSPIDLSTPANMRCRFYLMSRLYRNNTSIRWNRNPADSTNTKAGKRVSMTNFTCPLPPAGLVGFNPDANGDGFADKPVPCIQLQDDATGRTAIFYYSGANFQNVTGNTCGGAGFIAQVAPCDDPTGTLNQAVVDAINKAMNLAVPVDANGKLTFKSTGAGSGAAGMEVTPASSFPLSQGTYSLEGLTPPDEGVSGTQNTPLGNALENVRTDTTVHPAGGTGVFPPRPAAAVGLQKNFVILVTDGDDTCGGATFAAERASALFYESKPGTVPTNFAAEPTDPQHQATTFVIAFGTGIAPANANLIAQGGSGATISGSAATCPTGANCRNAFVANNTAQLVDALNQAIALAASSGTFAASPGVVDNVFEYAGFVPPAGSYDPLNPNSRFKTTVPVLVQPTFELPAFKGHLTAYMNKSTAPSCPTGATEPVAGTCQLWDAGQKLYDRLTKTPSGATCALTDTTCMATTGEYTFGELMGTATLANAGTATDLRIRRRIFSTAGNGVAPPQVALWPPSTAGSNTTCATDAACFAAGNGAAPRSILTGTNGDPLGALDVALGIAGMDFFALQTEFMACQGTNVPAVCADATGPPPNRNNVRRAKREAREIILAAAAGAEVVTAAPGLKRNSSNELLYRAKSWMLAESSYASPAVITRSPDKPTDNEMQEWTLFRDGPRSATTGNAIDNVSLGFGNRNPDKDGTAASAANLNLKPFMTFVIYPANDMLHAFRAGLCPTTTADCAGEGGGEEMWAFVPYDQLGKLLSTRKLQNRTGKVYMMASSIRYGDVFIPSTPFTISSAGPQSYNGRWKKLVYFGRGLGGRHYSGLDVTLTGPFTRHSLKTGLPTVLWNRGNPDTDDGQPKTAANSYNNTFAGASDYAAYLGMGETWSVPALTRVKPASNTTPRTGSAGVLFALYTGSGFSDDAAEGTTFYALDSLTGDVIHSKDIGDRSGAAAGVPDNLNALVADAAAYQPNSLVPGTALPNAANEAATRVFIGDLHGRLWKFATDDPGFSLTVPAAPFADLGEDHPVAVAVGLLNYDSTGTDGQKAHVYVASGGDARVDVPPAFRMFGFKEESTGASSVVSGFPLDFPPLPLPGYRGTVQPTTAYNSLGRGRVFFTGTRFNPPGANCVSTFSSIIFALTAGTAQAAYDLSATGPDESVEIGGKVITPPNTGTGEPEVVTGDRIAGPPPPPPAPKPVGILGATLSVYGTSGPGGSPTYRMTSGVCN